MNKIGQIEKILGTKVDNVWGNDDKVALNKLVNPKKTQVPPQGATPDVQDIPPNPDVVQPTNYK